MTLRILGAVLAGGQARRFGSDKAMALLDGRPLIDHVIDGIAGQVDAIAVCGRAYRDYAALFDRPAPGLGPLGGLNAALHHARDNGFDLVLTVGCDMPGVRPNMVETMIGHEPVVLADQRIIGLWPAALADMLDAHLASSPDRSIRAWMRACHAGEAPFAAHIANINSAEDLAGLAARRT